MVRELCTHKAIMKKEYSEGHIKLICQAANFKSSY